MKGFQAREPFFLHPYQGQSLATRTRLRLLVVVLLGIWVTLPLTGGPVLADGSPGAVKLVVLFLALFFPGLLWDLRRGHRHRVVFLLALVLPLVVAVPQLVEAANGYDPLKLERFTVQTLLLLVVVSSVTEKWQWFVLTLSILVGALSLEHFVVMVPPAGQEPATGVYVRSLVNIGIAAALLVYLQGAFQRAISQVEEANLHLEAKVADRTRQLQRAQESLVEGERLTALGRLTASVAHEVNTPLGAIQSSNQTIRTVLPDLMGRAVSLFGRLSSDQEEILVDMVDHCLSDESRRQGRERRAFRRELQQTLEVWGVAEAPALADQLADAGLAGLSPTWKPLLTSSDGPEVCQFVMDFDTVRRAGGIIDEATRKAARYILALRQSLDDQHAEFTKTPVDVGASLESVLILLGSRLGPVTLDQRLAPDLVALAHPGRLMQVWNRLLTNALDAMPDGGILTLVARRAGTEVVVEVGDTGARRPESWGDPGGPSLLETTPFGPGLGLAVAKAITEDYGGTLTFASEGERNQVTVRLPQASNKES